MEKQPDQGANPSKPEKHKLSPDFIRLGSKDTSLEYDANPQSSRKRDRDSNGGDISDKRIRLESSTQAINNARRGFIERYIAEIPPELSNLWNEANQLRDSNQRKIERLKFLRSLISGNHSENELEGYETIINRFKNTQSLFNDSDSIWTKHIGHWNFKERLQKELDELDQSSKEQVSAEVFSRKFSPIMKELTTRIKDARGRLEPYINGQKKISYALDAQIEQVDWSEVVDIYENIAKRERRELTKLASTTKSQVEQAENYSGTEVTDSARNSLREVNSSNLRSKKLAETLSGIIENAGDDFGRSIELQLQAIKEYRGKLSETFRKVQDSSQNLLLEFERLKGQKIEESGSLINFGGANVVSHML